MAPGFVRGVFHSSTIHRPERSYSYDSPPLTSPPPSAAARMCASKGSRCHGARELEDRSGQTSLLAPATPSPSRAHAHAPAHDEAVASDAGQCERAGTWRSFAACGCAELVPDTTCSEASRRARHLAGVRSTRSPPLAWLGSCKRPQPLAHAETHRRQADRSSAARHASIARLSCCLSLPTRRRRRLARRPPPAAAASADRRTRHARTPGSSQPGRSIKACVAGSMASMQARGGLPDHYTYM